MLNFIQSVQLISSTTLRHNLIFHKEKAPKGEVNVSFNLKSELADNNSAKAKKIKLRFVSSSNAKNEQDEALMELELITEYVFKIIDSGEFFAADEETRIKYCSNLAYLDFRGKLSKAFFDIGMQGFELPMSVEQLA